MKNKSLEKSGFPVYKNLMYRLVEKYKNAGFYVRNEPFYGFKIYINKRDYDNEYKTQYYDGAFIRITNLSLKIQKYSRLLDGCLNSFTGWKELCVYDFNERSKPTCMQYISYYLNNKNENEYPEIYYKMLLKYNKLCKIDKDFE